MHTQVYATIIAAYSTSYINKVHRVTKNIHVNLFKQTTNITKNKKDKIVSTPGKI